MKYVATIKEVKSEYKKLSPHISEIWHCGYYIPKSCRGEYGDYFSEKLIKLKYGKDTKHWIDFITPPLEVLHSLEYHFDFILRALHSDETMFTPNPIDTVVESISKIFSCKYKTDWLAKNWTTEPTHNYKTYEERADVLNKAYVAKIKQQSNEEKSILIFDDILTSGSTFNTIANLIKNRIYPKAKIYCFAIARTSHEPNANQEYNAEAELAAVSNLAGRSLTAKAAMRSNVSLVDVISDEIMNF